MLSAFKVSPFDYFGYEWIVEVYCFTKRRYLKLVVCCMVIL